MRLPSFEELAVALAAGAGTVALAGSSGGFYPVAWNLGALAAAWIALGALLLLRPARPGAWTLALAAALAGLVGWTALSAVWSVSVPRSFLEAERALLYATLVVAVLALGRRARLPLLAAGVLGGAAVVCSWNLAVRWGQSRNGPESNPIGYANGLALLAAVGVLLALGFALERRRPVVLAAAVPMLAVLALSHSTGSWVALVCGVLILVLARSAVRTRTVAVATAVLTVAFAVTAWSQARGHERGAYWSVAVRVVDAHPGLGSGAGTYDVEWLRLRHEAFSTLDAHNLYLETLQELGPLGLLLVVATILLPLAAATRVRRQPLVPAAGAALAAYALEAGIDFQWELAAVTAPVLLLAAGLTVTADAEQPELRAGGRSVLAIAVLAAGVAAALALAGSAPLSTAGDALARGDYRTARADAATATRRSPWSSQAWLRLGLARLELGDRAGARAALGHAAAKDPDDWLVWLRLADATTGEPHRRALARAARLNPLYFRSG